MKFHKQLVFLFGCIALIGYLSFHFAPVDTPVSSVVKRDEQSAHIQVYLKDDSGTLVPLSIQVSEELGEEEKLQLMFAYMSGKQTIKGFHPLFKKECVLSQVEIKDGKASLFFDDSFKQYDKKDELRVLESITWGATQFHDVEQVAMYLNDSALTMMPKASTPIPTILNRSIGINHFETTTSTLHDSTSITVFALKKIQGNEYLVPRSKRVALQDGSLDQGVSAILDDISVSSDLSQPLFADHIEVQKYHMDNGTLTLELNKNILASDASVKQNVYDTLVLSLGMLDSVEKVEIKVDGMVVTPKTQNDTAVSKYELTYNEVTF